MQVAPNFIIRFALSIAKLSEFKRKLKRYLFGFVVQFAMWRTEEIESLAWERQVFSFILPLKEGY